MPPTQASDGAVGGDDVVLAVSKGLLKKSMTAMGAAVDRLIARLKTDGQFRKFIFTEPFHMSADIDPAMVEMFDSTIRGLCLSANDGLCQDLLEQLNDMTPTEEEAAQGWRGGMDAAKALIAARIPPVEEASDDDAPELPPPKPRLALP